MFTASVRGKTIDKNKLIRWFAVVMIPVLALMMGASAPEVWAQDDPPVCRFDIEFNSSDQDVGVRGFFDYEPWRKLKIWDANGKKIADIMAKKNLRLQGFAELMFESGEPNLEDLTLLKFFERFDEGDYKFQAKKNRGRWTNCKELFTHVIPCGPEITAGFNSPDFIISWEEVTTVVDPNDTPNIVGEVSCLPPGDLGQTLTIVGYEVIVETEVDGKEKIFKVDVPSDVFEVNVPQEFLDLGDEFQYEVLAIEETGNQTITEDKFCLNENGDAVIECPEDEE
jgi:hypothetical protein